MSSVPAIYEHGVFRPLQMVDLPESTRVEVTFSDAELVPIPPGLAEIRAVLEMRYSGEPDESSRADPAQKLDDEPAPTRKVKTKESHAAWLRDLERRRARSFTGHRGISPQEILDDLRSERGT